MYQVAFLLTLLTIFSNYESSANKYYPSTISGLYPGISDLDSSHVIGGGIESVPSIGHGVENFHYERGLRTPDIGIGIDTFKRANIGHGHNIGYDTGSIFPIGIGTKVVHPIGLSPISSGVEAFSPIRTDMGRMSLEEGEVLDRNIYSSGTKNFNDGHHENLNNNHGELTNHKGEGFSNEEAAVKQINGESSHYANIDEEKKLYHDGKEYHGDEHFDEEGKKSLEKNVNQGHKKGHNIKGFKSYHNKDESGKTEEFYDEDHDEGGIYAFDGHFGNFGERGASSYKGHETDEKLNSDEAKKKGYNDNEYFVDNSHIHRGKFGDNKYAVNRGIFGYNTGIDKNDFNGHHERNKFYKISPIY